MIRNHCVAAVSGLIINDVNINFSCFVHNHGFCFLQVWSPVVTASSGRSLLSRYGLLDTLSYEVLKKCATLWIVVQDLVQTGEWGMGVASFFLLLLQSAVINHGYIQRRQLKRFLFQ